MTILLESIESKVLRLEQENAELKRIISEQAKILTVSFRVIFFCFGIGVTIIFGLLRRAFHQQIT
ncbi:MAG: hypothetical protein LBI18_04110 [Planctomycetaceae bacterium]|nr:hypothetical protein [Planctomycetaceae bacterium]